MSILKDNKFIKLSKMLWQAYGRYKFQMMILSILSFLNGLLEGIGISTLIPIFSLVVKDQSKSSDFISKAIEDFFSHLNFNFNLKTLLIFISILLLLKIIVLLIANYIIATITANYAKITRGELILSTFKANWPHLLKQKIGYLDQILITDVNNTLALFLYLSTSSLIFAQLFIYILVAINISISVTFSILLVGLIIMFYFKRFFYKNKILSQKTESLYKQISHFVNENIIGLKTIKSMSIEQKILNKGYQYFDELKNLNIHMAMVRSITNVLIQPIGLIFAVGIFVFLFKTTSFNFASFIVLIYAINKIFSQIQMGQTSLNAISALVPYLASISQFRESMEENKEVSSGIKNFKFNNIIEFKDISFFYNDQKEILSGVNFSIKKGEIIGLIGPSGAGKTTLVDIFLRLLTPLKGKILLDDEDVANISLKEWRSNIGYVSQDVFLINDTIENNIKFYGEKITEQDVISAAKMANIYEFIEKLPDKFLTVIGERGIMLSGGQRQRIALAKILVRKPQILILDEATNALDNESEKLIRESIESLRGQITVIVIAHRLSTVMSVDHLLVLDNGKIIEEGKPTDLLNNKGSYFAKIYT